MKWIMNRPADQIAEELEILLHAEGADLGRIREVVFFLYRGNKDDKLLFALCEALNGPVTIHKYADIRGWVLELCKEIRKL